MSAELLPMWVIYDHPSDCPDAFIARKWMIAVGVVQATTETMTEQDIETLRKYFEAGGWTNIARHPTDSPVIVESWI